MNSRLESNPELKPFQRNEESIFKPMTDPYTDPYWHDELIRDLDQTIFNPNEFARTYTIGANFETSRQVLGVMTRFPTNRDDVSDISNLSINSAVFYMKRKDFVKLPDWQHYLRAGANIFINHIKYSIERVDSDYGFVLMNLNQVQGKVA